MKDTDEMNPVVDVVQHIRNNQRANALDAIDQIMNARASVALDTYKKIVAKGMFDEPVPDQEEQ